MIDLYQINEISNRDLSLLHYYRILRKPSDFLSAIYDDGEPDVTEIMTGTATELETESGEPVYAFSLGIAEKADYIPYLEFDTTNENDRKHLETLLYLDGTTLYGKSAEFEDAVQIRVYWVSSLESIKQAIQDYLTALDELDISSLRDSFNDKKNQPKGIAAISGRDQNLVEFTEGDSGLTMKDSDYLITSALEGQLLTNPSQELLMSLPRRLKHNINISVTDGATRYLSQFSGYTINIRGNGNWVIRDVESGIDFVTGSGKVYLWNCKLVHFRSATDEKYSSSNQFKCSYLYAHRSLVIQNQGVIDDMYLVGGTTFIRVPFQVGFGSEEGIKNVSLVGHGCSLYSWNSAVPVDTTKILGLVWWTEYGGFTDGEGVSLYIAGRRIDESSGEHDAELQPSQIVEYNVDNIHIYQGSD